MLKTLITSLIVLAAALPLSAQQVGPGMGSTDRLPSGGWGGEAAYGEVCTHNQREGSLNIRLNPNLHARSLGQISNGTMIELYNGTYGEDGFWWWRTHYGDKWGWVRADYICGDPQ